MYDTTTRLRQLWTLAQLETERMEQVKNLEILLPSERRALIEASIARLVAWRDEAEALRVEASVWGMN